MQKFTTRTSVQTREIGLKLAKKLRLGDILALIGDLGSGKTTFLKGLAKGLSIKQRVKSPTFVQLKIYPLPKKKNSFLYHFDFYRLDSFSELEAKGLKEYLKIKKGIVVIEWADKIMNLLPKKTKVIRFSFIDKNSRLIIFS